MSDIVGRLRTDVLWHQRRGNETIAQDCKEAADLIESLLKQIVPLVNGIRDMAAEINALRAEVEALRKDAARGAAKRSCPGPSCHGCKQCDSY